jgi:hypothetical protein
MQDSKTQIDTKGLVSYTYKSSIGVEVECHLKHKLEEHSTLFEPGCVESMELVYALVNNVDISDLMGADLVKTIEDLALQSLKMDAFTAAIDAAQTKFEDKWISQS